MISRLTYNDTRPSFVLLSFNSLWVQEQMNTSGVGYTEYEVGNNNIHYFHTALGNN